MTREDALVVVARLLRDWSTPVVSGGDQERWLTALTADSCTIGQVDEALDFFQARLERPTVREIRDRMRRQQETVSGGLERSTALDPGVVEVGRTHIALIRRQLKGAQT